MVGWPTVRREKVVIKLMRGGSKKSGVVGGSLFGKARFLKSKH